jgi:hypothetical protein
VWVKFSAARKVLVTPPGRCTAAEYLHVVQQLLAELPSRIHEICIKRLQGQGYRWPPGDSALFVQQLLTAAFASSLRCLTLDQGITTAAANTILSQLPSLQQVSLLISDAPNSTDTRSTQRWHPSADLAHLTALNLRCSSSLLVDISGLGSATRLQALHISDAAADSLPALSLLTALQDVSIEVSTRSAALPSAQCFATLRQLRTLSMPQVECSAATWRALASLPSLQTIELDKLTIDASAPPAAVTALRKRQPSCVEQYGACATLQLQHAAQELRGCLARQLPCLQQLAAASPSLSDLATALQGHSGLRQLHFFGSSDTDVAWPAPLLCQLPALQRLTLESTRRAPDALLADASQCSRLTQLCLQAHYQAADVTATGLAALAAGPCRSSLRELVGDVRGVGPAAAAVLLRALPRLCEATMWLSLPEAGLGSRECEELLQQVLAQQGVAAAWVPRARTRSYPDRASWRCSFALRGSSGAAAQG